MSSLAIFILTTFNVLISFFIMRVWCQYLRVSTNNVVARSILLVTRIPVAMLGNKVSRGINLSAGSAVVIFLRIILPDQLYLHLIQFVFPAGIHCDLDMLSVPHIGIYIPVALAVEMIVHPVIHLKRLPDIHIGIAR